MEPPKLHGEHAPIDKIYRDKIRTKACLANALVKNLTWRPENIIFGRKMQRAGITQFYCMINHG